MSRDAYIRLARISGTSHRAPAAASGRFEPIARRLKIAQKQTLVVRSSCGYYSLVTGAAVTAKLVTAKLVTAKLVTAKLVTAKLATAPLLP